MAKKGIRIVAGGSDIRSPVYPSVGSFKKDHRKTRAHSKGRARRGSARY